MKAKDLAEILLQNPEFDILVSGYEYGIEMLESQNVRVIKYYKRQQPEGEEYEYWAGDYEEYKGRNSDGVLEDGILLSRS